ncbi:MAG TPA: IMP dehydrogenase [Chthoniobacteraceae bacterium]|nr:IMP dehydrogenase [Chthoniobacteraceae bacterium]
MAAHSSPIDAEFYLAADTFFPAQGATALTYDDVTLATLFSDVLPRDTNLETTLHDRIRLPLPIVSADMDTVTEARMAIAMARNGGLGLVHANVPERQQLSEVSRVKNHVHGLIQEPIKVSPDHSIGDVLELIEEKGYSFRTFPVVDAEEKLLGLLPGHVVRPRYAAIRIVDAMTPRAQVQTVLQNELGDDPIARADRFFSERVGIHKLLVVDKNDRLRGLFTISDIERILAERSSHTLKPARDEKFRLLCGAALSATRNTAGELDRDRILGHVTALVDRGVDAVAVSTAHGFSRGVGDAVTLIRSEFKELPIIAGNVTSAAGVEYLADAGANIIKVGQGPGSICTTRVVAGVGVPQLTALYVSARAAAPKGVRILADGGVTKSGDIVKALTLAHGVICGGLLAGCPEAPGQILEIDGKLYKQYRGMGSLAAMQAGSAARYGHVAKDTTRKVAAEGVEALKEAGPPVDTVLLQLAGGVQSGLGYLGARSLTELRENARYIRVTPAGQRESAPHDIIEVKAGT